MNKDARSGKLALQLSSMGLRDLILLTHASSSPPATFNRNKTHTRTIWGSRAIDVIYAGYGPFDALYLSAHSEEHKLLCVGKQIAHV